MNKLAHLFLTALTIAILTMLAAIAWSQPATDAALTARLLDSLTKEPLARASIQISTSKGGITNNSGMATILRIRPDTYDLIAKYVGYHWKTIPNIVIRNGDSLHYEILLSPRRDTQIVSILPIKPPIQISKGVTSVFGGISIQGQREVDSIIRAEPPTMSDIVSGRPGSRFQISEISVRGQSSKTIDTTSRVYRVYYKK